MEQQVGFHSHLTAFTVIELPVNPREPHVPPSIRTGSHVEVEAR